MLTPAAELGRERFGGRPRLLLAGNAAHTDIPLDAPGSGPDGDADVDARPDGRLPRPRGWRRQPHRRPGPPAASPSAARSSATPRGRRGGAGSARGRRPDVEWGPVGRRAGRARRRARPRPCTATCCRAAPSPSGCAGRHRLPARPRHGEGGLGAQRPGALGATAARRARDGARRRTDVADLVRFSGGGRAWCRPGRSCWPGR